MAIPQAPQDSARYARLSNPALRRALESAVRRRLHGDDADDVVQATLADVLAAGDVPGEPEEFRRFVFGVARNKVFDHFRRSAREVSEERAAELASFEPPHAAGDILRWAEGKLPDSESKHTLEWMLREGDGEKLEQIAREANLPAPRVRKRVSRLRRFLRERWAAELALLTVLFVGLGFYLYARHKAPEVRREPLPPRPSSQLLPERPAGDLPAPFPAPPPARAPAPSVAPSVAPSASTSAPPSGLGDLGLLTGTGSGGLGTNPHPKPVRATHPISSARAAPARPPAASDKPGGSDLDETPSPRALDKRQK